MSSHAMSDLGDGLVRWALGAELTERSPSVGPDRASRVLVALALHADPTGVAWPSAATLASMLGGLQRRDVRNALELLEANRLIERVATAPTARRSITWRILAPDVASWASNRRAQDVAGYPATAPSGTSETLRKSVAGYPATEGGSHVAGHVAGRVAGHVAVYPAAKEREQNSLGDDVASASIGARTSRACTRHAHWAHDEPCRACMVDRNAEKSRGAAQHLGRTDGLRTGHRPLAEVSAAERAMIEDALRGYRCDLPEHLSIALVEARLERDLLTPVGV
ncbi:helix-turn-helix domain-containing protein [Microbacterium sp. NPDC058021]|uniref:helix-turn-helix domain-containing protein n=1 Tax=Microbacterium sp. NPDC058021 TaxID=3346306 RepID=UPI0036DC4DEB